MVGNLPSKLVGFLCVHADLCADFDGLYKFSEFCLVSFETIGMAHFGMAS